MPSNSKIWNDAGIDNADSFNKLLYNGPSEAIVAELTRKIEDFPFGVLHVRGINEETYQSLADESESGTSFNYPVTSSTDPYLFVLAMKAVKHGEKYVGYDNIGVRKIDLRTGETILSLHDNDMSPDPPYTRIWISTIIGHKSADVLYCSIGMQRPDGDNLPVDYFLCALDISNGEIKRLTILSKPFL